MDRLRILVVRHAEPEVPAADGPPEPLRPLAGRGRRQAEELAEELCAAAPHTIVSSPYRRALDTVRPAARRLGGSACRSSCCTTSGSGDPESGHP
ncbi:MAG TPA: histidine phosphatase family protein [Actinomycetes bacterium]|nr:histidine phosphatase family protein [Actinomycetes bacterium]